MAPLLTLFAFSVALLGERLGERLKGDLPCDSPLLTDDLLSVPAGGSVVTGSLPFCLSLFVVATSSGASGWDLELCIGLILLFLLWRLLVVLNSGLPTSLDLPLVSLVGGCTCEGSSVLCPDRPPLFESLSLVPFDPLVLTLGCRPVLGPDDVESGAFLPLPEVVGSSRLCLLTVPGFLEVWLSFFLPSLDLGSCFGCGIVVSYLSFFTQPRASAVVTVGIGGGVYAFLGFTMPFLPRIVIMRGSGCKAHEGKAKAQGKAVRLGHERAHCLFYNEGSAHGYDETSFVLLSVNESHANVTTVCSRDDKVQLYGMLKLKASAIRKKSKGMRHGPMNWD